jgi:hypothetical protein
MSTRRATAWQGLDRDHRRWLLINAVLIAAVVNAALSALIAWLSAVNEDQIPLWSAPLVGGPSTVTDTVGTLFVLPFLTTLVITTVIRGELEHGRLRPLAETLRLSERLPHGRARRAALLGLLCMLLLGPIAVAILVLTDFDDLGVGEFVLYKALFGIGLGALVTPPIALLALGDRRA